MVLEVPFMYQQHEHPYDYFRYTKFGLEYMFKKAGFEVLLVQPTSGFFTMWFVKMNYFSLKWLKGSKFKRFFIKLLIEPIWYICQVLAPRLDKMHRGWSDFANGFYVVAKK